MRVPTPGAPNRRWRDLPVTASLTGHASLPRLQRRHERPGDLDGGGREARTRVRARLSALEAKWSATSGPTIARQFAAGL